MVNERLIVGPECVIVIAHSRAGVSDQQQLCKEGYGCSAVNISSLANGALGEHRRAQKEIRLADAAQGCGQWQSLSGGNLVGQVGRRSGW
jgi:hypothetical protein